MCVTGANLSVERGSLIPSGALKLLFSTEASVVLPKSTDRCSLWIGIRPHRLEVLLCGAACAARMARMQMEDVRRLLAEPVAHVKGV